MASKQSERSQKTLRVHQKLEADKKHQLTDKMKTLKEKLEICEQFKSLKF